MTSVKRTARRHLDQRLTGLELGERPPRGWIRAIREALGMTTGELSQRMGITQSRISQIERSEELGSIRLDTLQRTAAALNCQVHYVFIPNESLEDMVQQRAIVKAQAELNTVRHSMALEDQASSESSDDEMVRELAEQLMEARNLWSDAKGRTPH